MAKDNLFLGMAKGKIGDVVFYRRNGEQISRSRNRQPSNPKTVGQQYQRAIMATVLRAYSAGKAIFDHSFQSVKFGGDSQSHFLKINLNKLRGAVSNDIGSGASAATSVGRVVAPGITSPVPFSYIISEGSYNQYLFSYNAGYSLPAAQTSETVAAYAARVGLIAGDIYTLCVLAVNDSVVLFNAAPDLNDPLAKQFQSSFFFVRMTVKANLDTVTDAVATYGQLFEFDKSTVVPGLGGTTPINEVLDISQLTDTRNSNGALGMIRSRDNEDLRSNTTMELIGIDNVGIASYYLQDAWSRQASLRDSAYILEGGGFQTGV